MRPKMLVYNLLTLAILIIYVMAQEIDSMQQEADYVVDGVLLLILAFMWASQPSHMRWRDTSACLAIVCCIKVVYFVDRQRSYNYNTEADLTAWREWLGEERIIISFLPLVGMFFLENKICRHYSFGQL